MSLYKWSQTGTANSSSDPTVNYAEGQAPSSLNDSARNAMAAVAKYRDDIAGAIVTTGTSTAYLVSSYQQFDTLAHLSGQMIAFTPHTTNTGTCTLNVDSLTAKALRSAPNVELPAGTLIQGTPYLALYNNADGAFYLRGFFGNPYSIPIGGSIDYWLPTAPNSSFVFPFGQAISRSVYATLFAAMTTTYGAGDGSTTFNLPDLRGRVTASPDNMGGGTDPNRLTSGSLAGVRNSIGGAGGESAHTLSTAEIPTLTSTQNGIGVTVSPGGGAGIPITSSPGNISAFGTSGGGVAAATSNSGVWSGIGSLSGTINVSATSSGTSGTTHNNMQPTILCNRIMRII